MMVVLFSTTTLVAAVPPNVRIDPAAKLVPVTVTVVPPAAGPVFGDTLVTVGGRVRLAAPDELSLSQLLFTVTASMFAGGVMAVLTVLFSTTKLVAIFSRKAPLEPPADCVPARVTAGRPPVARLFADTVLANGRTVCPDRVAAGDATTRASVMSPFGDADSSRVRPLPGPLVELVTSSAPTIELAGLLEVELP